MASSACAWRRRAWRARRRAIHARPVPRNASHTPAKTSSVTLRAKRKVGCVVHGSLRCRLDTGKVTSPHCPMESIMFFPYWAVLLTSMSRPSSANTLTAFRAVGEVQNLRAAADVLHLTHSAVSQQIRGLEEQLGFALFERRGRRVVLNPPAKRCCAACRPRCLSSTTACRRPRRRPAAPRSGSG